MKDNKWKKILTGKIGVTLGLCILTIAVAVGALGIYHRQVEKYFSDSPNDIAKADTELTTEGLEDGDDISRAQVKQETEPEETAETEPEQTVQAAELPSADTGEGMLVESEAGQEPEMSGEEAAEAAGNDLQAADLSFAPENGMLWPVEGSVVLDYSPDTTIYFPTLDQYRTNNGILIQSEVGTSVVAPADARVEAVGYDDMIGTYVLMNLGNGYQVTCGQLKDVCVTPEQIIHAGDIIGSVNTPTRFFYVEGANLFLRMTKDGNTVDPLDYAR